MAGEIPQQVRIGTLIAAVERVKKFPGKGKDAQAIDGQWLRNGNRLMVRDGLPRQYEQTIVLHETIHALLDRCGLNILLAEYNEHLEELLVCNLGEWLLDVIQTNPELVEYLTTV